VVHSFGVHSVNSAVWVTTKRGELLRRFFKGVRPVRKKIILKLALSK